MKIAATIARYLMGFMFTVFGLNGFLHFLPQSAPAAPLALQYMTVLSQSGYFNAVFALQLLSGILLLANRFVALALVFLAPILANILLFHALMDPAGIAPGVVATILWFLVFSSVQDAFKGILRPTV
jgi:hypothetical protein